MSCVRQGASDLTFDGGGGGGGSGAELGRVGGRLLRIARCTCEREPPGPGLWGCAAISVFAIDGGEPLPGEEGLSLGG